MEKVLYFFQHSTFWKSRATACWQACLEVHNYAMTGRITCCHDSFERSWFIDRKLWHWLCLDRSSCVWSCHIRDGSWNPKNIHSLQALSPLHSHIYLYIALFEMALEYFFDENLYLKNVFPDETNRIEGACSGSYKWTTRNLWKKATTMYFKLLPMMMWWKMPRLGCFNITVTKSHFQIKDELPASNRDYSGFFFAVAVLQLECKPEALLSSWRSIYTSIKYKRLWHTH